MSTIRETSMATAVKLGSLQGVKAVTPVKLTQAQPAQPQVQTQAPTAVEVGNRKTVNKMTNNSTIGKMLSEQELQAKALATASTMKTIATEMKSLFLEREEVIESMFLALIAGHHILLLGPPGTGKSAITKEFTRRITSARMFEWLLNRTSDPSEILGPISIKNMERDKFVRITDNKIGDCEIAFLDEIFKSNEPTLNALLPILNERVIYNDGQAMPIPLKMMVAASNETPQEDEGLEALYDRILFKHWVDYIKEPNNRIQMMVNYNNAKNPTTQSQITRTTVNMDDVEAVQNYKDYVQVPPAVIKIFNKLLLSLNKKHITFSDRKVNWCMDIIKASALYNGRTVATTSDIVPLENVLWEKPEDIMEIQLAITNIIDPYSSKIKQWTNEGTAIINDITGLYDTNKPKAIEETLEAKTKIETIINKMDKTIVDATKDGKDITEYANARNNLSQKLQDLVCKVLGIQPAAFNTAPTEDVVSTANSAVDEFLSDDIW